MISVRSKTKYIFILVLALVPLLTGCQKQICSYCGEEKYCDEYKVIDTTRYICRECMNDPSITTSGNVVSEYQAPPLDPSLFGVGSDWHNKHDEKTIENNADTYNDVNNDNLDSQDNEFAQNDELPQNSEEYENGVDSESVTEAQSNNPVSSTNESINEILNNLAPLLATSGLQLSPDNSGKNNYFVNDSSGNNTNIILTFNTSSEKPSLTISAQDFNNSNCKNTCLAAMEVFTSTNDVNHLENDILNNVIEHGHYSSNGCIFYYDQDSTNNSQLQIEFQ